MGSPVPARAHEPRGEKLSRAWQSERREASRSNWHPLQTAGFQIKYFKVHKCYSRLSQRYVIWLDEYQKQILLKSKTTHALIRLAVLKGAFTHVQVVLPFPQKPTKGVAKAGVVPAEDGYTQEPPNPHFLWQAGPRQPAISTLYVNGLVWHRSNFQSTHSSHDKQALDKHISRWSHLSNRNYDFFIICEFLFISHKHVSFVSSSAWNKTT